MSNDPTEIMYAYGDRRNGWYCVALDANGYLVSDSVYRWSKAEIIRESERMAMDLSQETGKNLPIVRG